MRESIAVVIVVESTKTPALAASDAAEGQTVPARLVDHCPRTELKRLEAPTVLMPRAWAWSLFLLLVSLSASGCVNTSTHRTTSPDSPPAISAVQTHGKQAAGLHHPVIDTVCYESPDQVADATEELLELTPPERLPRVDEGITYSKEGALSLEALEQMALAHNPSIRQAAAVVCQLRGIQQQVGLKPNPAIGYFGDEIGNDDSAGLHGAFISQTLVRGHKLARNQEVIRHDVEAARANVDAQRFRVLNDLRTQFYEVLAAQRKLDLARQFLVVAKQGVAVSRELLEAQEGARPDVLQSEMQLSQVQLAIQRTQFELQGAWNELAALAGIPELPLTTLVGELAIPVEPRDFDATYDELLMTSPLLQAAHARLRRAQSNLMRQRVQPIPNLNGQLGAGYDDATGDEFANVQLTLPIPLHNYNQGNVRAAQAEACQAQQNLDRIRLKLKRDLAQVMRDFQVAKATVDQYRDAIVPQADQALDLLLAAQEAGEFDFLRVFTARRMYYESNWEYVTALAQLAQAQTRIDCLLLSGGLSFPATSTPDDNLRGQALSWQ